MRNSCLLVVFVIAITAELTMASRPQYDSESPQKDLQLLTEEVSNLLTEATKEIEDLMSNVMLLMDCAMTMKRTIEPSPFLSKSSNVNAVDDAIKALKTRKLKDDLEDEIQEENKYNTHFRAFKESINDTKEDPW